MAKQRALVASPSALAMPSSSSSYLSPTQMSHARKSYLSTPPPPLVIEQEPVTPRDMALPSSPLVSLASSPIPLRSAERGLCLWWISFCLFLGALFYLSIIFLIKDQPPLVLQRIEHDDQAVCLDGRPAGYYFRRGRQPWSDSFILFFEGGGWCLNEYECAARAQTEFGSLDSRPARMAGWGMLEYDNFKNPDLALFSHVYIPYCDGASFGGSVVGEKQVGHTNIFFRGRQIVKAVVEDLKIRHGLARAERVLVSGCSAGGLAAYWHADSIAAWIANPLTIVKAAPDSGFFPRLVSLDGQPVFAARMERVFRMQNMTASMQSSCLERFSPDQQWQCMFVEEMRKTMRVPSMPLQSLYDTWILEHVYAIDRPIWKECLQQGDVLSGYFRLCLGFHEKRLGPQACRFYQLYLFKEQVALPLKNAIFETTNTTRGDGMFLHSCWNHCGLQNEDHWTKTRIENVAANVALRDWVFGHIGNHTHVDCLHSTTRQCNPFCFYFFVLVLVSSSSSSSTNTCTGHCLDLAYRTVCQVPLELLQGRATTASHASTI